MVGTFWSLVPAIVDIALALFTKEVYSSLFIGIIIGGNFYAGANLSGIITHVVNDGLIVNSQLPYALTVAAVSFITYIIAGFTHNPIIPLILGVALLFGVLFFIKKVLLEK